MYKQCRTEQSARRQRELEELLCRMMQERRYEQITVSDFCAYAGIPRKAFYRYFSSKDGALYALLDHTMLDYEGYRTADMVLGDSLMAELEAYFRFWKDQRELLDALRYSGLSGILMERAINGGLESDVMRQMLPHDSPKLRSHIFRFAACGLMIMMVDWHENGYRESVAEMAAIAARLVSRPLFSKNDA